MREINVVIKVVHDRDGDNEDILSQAVGMLFEVNGKRVIEYEEKIVGFEGAISNKITVEPGKVSVKKTGTINTEMIFSRNESIRTEYFTPFGAMDMETKTNMLLIDEHEGNLNVYIEYDLYIDGEKASSSKMHIAVS